MQALPTPVVPEQRSTRGSDPTVAVVITVYNQAHYLAEAIRSVVSQTHPADEIIVVDDGSQDDPTPVVRCFRNVRLLRQSNQGVSGARNAGLHAACSDMVVFLDADDRLLPGAIATGIACHARSGECAMVYGGHRHISASGEPLGTSVYPENGLDPYLALLDFNTMGMSATVMYRRDVLIAAGGFDTNLPRCEDYDVYLRLARRSRIASHPDIVAEYRRHDSNMSSDHLGMLRWALFVQARNVENPDDPAIAKAWRAGQWRLRAYYARQILLEWQAGPGGVRDFALALTRTLRASPKYAVRLMLRTLLRQLPSPIASALRRFGHRPPLGRVRFGDLGRVFPIDEQFGYGRGTPVDRFYIESFLDMNRSDIAGRVLEVGDDTYSRRFGGENVTHQDILHFNAGNPYATIVGDLSAPGLLPEDRFDCIVLTQTLQFVFDIRCAIRNLYDALRPGGVLLLTVPCISRLERAPWDWFWGFTPAAVTRLFSEEFPTAELEVQSFGNVFAVTAFLQGVALEEVPRAKLAVRDALYPLVVAARLRKSPNGAAHISRAVPRSC